MGIRKMFIIASKVFCAITVILLILIIQRSIMTLHIIGMIANRAPGFDQYFSLMNEAQFEIHESAHFRNGLAPVRIHDKYGYIDKTGRVIIPPQFLEAGNFSDGVAWVSFGSIQRNGGANLGIIDTMGHLTPTPQITTNSYFLLPKPFSEGFAAFTQYNEMQGGKIHDNDALIGYVNKYGTVILQPSFISGCPFSSGLTSVVFAGSREQALIDITLFTRITSDYGFFGCFSEGLQGVVHTENGNMKTGYIDRHGEIIIPLSESITYRGDFSEGLAPATVNGECTYTDIKGVIRIPPFKCESNYPFKEGAAMIELDNGLLGYINKIGNWIIPAQYEKAGDFSEGLALVERGGKLEFIDETGKTILTTSMISLKGPGIDLKPVEHTTSQTVSNQIKQLDLPALSFMIGQDPVSVMENPNLKLRFEKILGPSLPDFEARLEISSNTEKNGDLIVGTGLMPHRGEFDDAAYAINIQTGTVCAVMRVNQEVKVFGVNAVTELPKPLTDWLEQ